MTKQEKTAEPLPLPRWLRQPLPVIDTYIQSYTYLLEIVRANAAFFAWEQYFSQLITLPSVPDWVLAPSEIVETEFVSTPVEADDNRSVNPSKKTEKNRREAQIPYPENAVYASPGKRGIDDAPGTSAKAASPSELESISKLFQPQVRIAVRRREPSPPEGRTKTDIAPSTGTPASHSTVSQDNGSPARFLERENLVSVDGPSTGTPASHSTVSHGSGLSGRFLKKENLISVKAVSFAHRRKMDSSGNATADPRRPAVSEIGETSHKTPASPPSLSSNLAFIEQAYGQTPAFQLSESGDTPLPQWRDRKVFDPYIESLNLLSKHIETEGWREKREAAIHHASLIEPLGDAHMPDEPIAGSSLNGGEAARAEAVDPMVWRERTTRRNGQWVQHIHNTFHVSLDAGKVSWEGADRIRLRQELRRILVEEAMLMGIDV